MLVWVYRFVVGVEGQPGRGRGQLRQCFPAQPGLVLAGSSNLAGLAGFHVSDVKGP